MLNPIKESIIVALRISMEELAAPIVIAITNTSYPSYALLLQPNRIHRQPKNPIPQKRTKGFLTPSLSDKCFVNPEKIRPAIYMARGTEAMYSFGSCRVLLTKNGVYSNAIWKNNLVVM